MPQIVTIQALRALAAVAIAVHHAGLGSLGILTLGSGVDLFFVISGFIMICSSWSAFGQSGAGALFLKRRIIRIVPLYWLATTLMVMMLLCSPGMSELMRGFWQGEHLDAAHLITSLIFYPFSDRFPTYIVGWTLNFEMSFYLIFAAAMFLPPRLAVAAISATLIAIVSLGALVGPLPMTNFACPLTIEFLAGVMIGLLYCEGFRIPKSAGIALVAAAMTGLWLSGIWNLDLPYVRACAWGIPAALLVAAATLPQWDWHGVTTYPFRLLGDASYALYLDHLLIIVLLRMYGASVGIPVAIALCIIMAILIHKIVERPVTVWLNARFVPRRMPESAGGNYAGMPSTAIQIEQNSFGSA